MNINFPDLNEVEFNPFPSAPDDGEDSLRYAFIRSWMRENAIFTGSKRFFGEGEDEDYVVTFKMLQRMEKEFPYTAQLITNNESNAETLYKYHSAKFEVGNQTINVIVVKKEEYIEWEYATEQFLKNCLCPYFKIKENRVRAFEEYREEYRNKLDK